MGISGLLPFIKNCCRPSNISDFKGCTVAVDAYSWLHKGAFSCADKLVKGEKTDGYVHYCMKQLNLLLNAGVKPIMVFDGCNLESKAVTEKKRRENREKTRQKGKELLCQGNLKEARECFQRCVDVTPEMAFEVIKACRAKNVSCIVAPYEADAQLAYLNKAGIVDIVITEDSDLVVFGCELILFKMDGCGGGLLYEKKNISKAFGLNAEKMSFEKFRFMCILSGCDYLPSLPGIGLAKACKFFTLTNNPDLLQVLPKMPSYLKMPKLEVTSEYKEAFVRANNTFLYQLVFCPKAKGLVPLNEYPDGMEGEEMDYAGRYVPDDIAYQIAMGNINVHTMKKFAISASDASAQKLSRTSTVKIPDGLWDVPEVKRESSFKVKQRPKSLLCPSPKKRKTCSTGNENLNHQHDDEVLFSTYKVGKSPEKKMNENTSNPESSSYVHSPFRKSLSVNSVNISKVPLNLPFKKIVRSRFFMNDTTDNSSGNVTETPSWLDSIDNEFQMCSPMLATSEFHGHESKEQDQDKHSPFSGSDQNIESSELMDISEKEDDSAIGSSYDSDLTNSKAELSLDSRGTLSGSFLSNSSGVDSLNESVNSNVFKDDTLPNDSSPNRVKCTSSYFDDVCRTSIGLADDHKSVLANGFSSSAGKLSGKPQTRCRTVGLSKNKRPKVEKKLPMKDTLFNFNFTRHS